MLMIGDRYSKIPWRAYRDRATFTVDVADSGKVRCAGIVLSCRHERHKRKREERVPDKFKDGMLAILQVIGKQRSSFPFAHQ